MTRGRVVAVCFAFVIAALSVVGVFAWRNAQVIPEIVDATLGVTAAHPYVVTVALLLTLGSAATRASRTKTLVDLGRRGTFRLHGGALAAGYFLNATLPFRLGEVLRAILLARGLRLSMLFTFAAVVFERLVDIIAVAAIFLILSVSSSYAPAALTIPVAITGVFAVLLVVGLVLLVRQNGALMAVVWHGSRIFGQRGEYRLRRAIWSLVHGFQQFERRPRTIAAYAGLTIASWVQSVAAMLLILAVFAPGSAVWIDAMAPFALSEALMAGADPSAYASALEAFWVDTGGLVGAGAADLGYAVWSVLDVPFMFIGLVVLSIWPLIGRPTALPAGSRSLDRADRATGELVTFLDAFFRRHQLAAILHDQDVSGEIALLRFYKGGSDAVTALIEDGDGPRVRKVVDAKYKERLASQHDWLLRHADAPGVVQVLEQHEAPEYFAIDLSYDPTTSALFDFIHEQPLERSEQVLRQVWDTMFERVYRLSSPGVHDEVIVEYISRRFEARVAEAMQADRTLLEADGASVVVINGAPHIPLRAQLEMVLADPVMMADLARFRTSSAVHGDLTIDNILVMAGSAAPVIIDPSDDNEVCGPIIDFARHLQSLWGGYEFLNEIDTAPEVVWSPTRDTVAISFLDMRSARYEALAAWTMAEAERKLTLAEVRSLPFHVGLFYGRMLTHRVVINPETTLIYYARATEFLTRFRAQYTTETAEL